jgi:WD40 repeat protein
LAVVGPSGSGKSSLVRAGLLPRLRVGALPGADTWYVAELYPGPQPFAELEQALLAVAASAPPNLLQRLQASSKGLLEVANELLPADPQAELLLLIDQFEELFTQVSDEGERAAFLALLQQAASDPQSRVRVLLTLRADFYDRPLLYPAFGALLRERTEVVLPLSPAELEQAISRPAQRVGAVVAPELVAEMVEEVATRPGALPLLQYALTELFDERKGRAITLADYRARGGLRGALARRADAVYEQLDAPGQAAARQIFLRLVTLGEGGEDTRRRALVRELRTENSEQPMHSAQSSVLSSFQVLTAFSNARLLTFDHDPLSREPTVEVAHEALIRSWGRLRSWIDGGREELRLQRALASAAAEWRSSQRDASFLARGARLGQFLTLAPANGAATLVLNADEQAFLEASSQREQAEVQARELARQNELAQAQALAQAERQRAEEQIAAGQRLRRRAIWLALALVVALLGLGAAGWFGLEAQRNATAAATERDRAEQQLVVADAQRLAFAAQGLPERSFETRLLLAIEAARRDRNLVTERVLRDAYARADWSTTILPHGEPLLGASFSRDGGLVLAAAGTTLTVWDTTGKQLFSFAEHSERIRASNSLPGDKRVVSGDQAGVVRLFDIHEGLVKEAKAHDATVIQLDYSPAAQLLVSTSEDDTARIWSSELEPVAVLRGHGGDVYRAMFSDDGRLIATVSEDKTVRVWQNDGKPLAILRSGDAAMTRVDWSPDGTMLAAAGDDGKMRIWDVATIERDGDRAQPIATVGGTFEAVVTAVEFRNDNRYLLFATFNGSIRLYAVDDLRADGDAAEPAASSYNVSTQLLTASFNRDGNRIVAINTDEYPVVFGFNQATSLLQELATLYGHGGVAVTARWSPDGQRIVSAGEDGTARIWSNVAPALLQDPTPRNYQMAVTPDERFTLTTYRTDDPADPGRTQLWDSTGKPLAELGGASTAAAFDEQESLIATGDDSGTLQLWALDGTKVADLVGHSDIIRNIRFSKDGQRLLSCSDDGRVFLWDRQGEQLALLEHETEVWHAEFSPDRTRIVTAASDGARLWDGEGRLLKELGEHTGRVDVALYSPDGTWFATGSNDDTARIWDNDGNLLAVLQHRDDVYELAFSDDGSRLMSVSADTTAKIWNRSGKLLLNLQHRTYVSHGGFTSDNRYYVTEAMDTVHLWNREGIEVATFEAGSSLSRTVYMPEGGRVLIIVRNGIRYEYPIDLDLLQQAAECRVGRGLNAEEIALYAVSEPLRFDFAARECGK